MSTQHVVDNPSSVDLFEARYGASAAHLESISHSTVIDQMLSHRSVRAYTDQPLPKNTLATLMAAAQSAATSSNLQTWSVVAVEDFARRSRISAWANNQAHIKVAPLFLAWIADLSRLDRVGESLGVKTDANRFTEMFLVSAIDAALAAQNAVLAAESLGLGTVYIGALRNKPTEVSAEFKLPRHAFPLFGLCVGYPDPDRPTAVKPRLEPHVIVHREQYSTHADAPAIERYNEVMRAFQQSQGMPVTDWSGQSAQRVAGPQSLSGRHVLKNEIGKQGFELE